MLLLLLLLLLLLRVIIRSRQEDGRIGKRTKNEGLNERINEEDE